jgi:hypothetical protein
VGECAIDASSTRTAVITGPATEALNVYQLQEVDGSIQIRV